MEKQITEIKTSLDLIHQRLDRLFMWAGSMQQELRLRTQAPALNSDKSQYFEMDSNVDDEEERLLTRIADLKQG